MAPDPGLGDMESSKAEKSWGKGGTASHLIYNKSKEYNVQLPDLDQLFKPVEEEEVSLFVGRGGPVSISEIAPGELQLFCTVNTKMLAVH